MQTVLENEEGATLEQKIKSKCIDKIVHYNEPTKAKKWNEVLKGMKYFGLLDPTTKVKGLLSRYGTIRNPKFKIW